MADGIVRVDAYAAAASRSGTAPYNYRGLQIHARRGLHEFAADLIGAHVPAGVSVLDLAAGSGAMSLRLHDLGYVVTAADLVTDNFRLRDRIPFLSFDLNGPFGQSVPRVDAIVALEIIEHLENPRHFLRQCVGALNPGGRLILSTPNIDNPFSKALFCRAGRFQWFSDDDYAGFGHITPLSQWQLVKCFAETGLEVVSMVSCADPSAGYTWRIRALARLLSMIGPTPRALQGEILVAVLQRPPR